MGWGSWRNIDAFNGADCSVRHVCINNAINLKRVVHVVGGRARLMIETFSCLRKIWADNCQSISMSACLTVCMTALSACLTVCMTALSACLTVCMTALSARLSECDTLSARVLLSFSWRSVYLF